MIRSNFARCSNFERGHRFGLHQLPMPLPLIPETGRNDGDRLDRKGWVWEHLRFEGWVSSWWAMSWTSFEAKRIERLSKVTITWHLFHCFDLFGMGIYNNYRPMFAPWSIPGLLMPWFLAVFGQPWNFEIFWLSPGRWVPFPATSRANDVMRTTKSTPAKRENGPLWCARCAKHTAFSARCWSAPRASKIRSVWQGTWRQKAGNSRDSNGSWNGGPQSHQQEGHD